MKLFDPGFLLKAAMIILLLSLVMIAEIFLIQFISGYLGTYFTLAVVAATGLGGLFFCFRDVSTIIGLVRTRAADGEFPDREMVSLAGAIIVGVMLLLPGFITDFLALIGFFPVIKTLYGRIATRGRSGKMHEIYEYLKIYE